MMLSGPSRFVLLTHLAALDHDWQSVDDNIEKATDTQAYPCCDADVDDLKSCDLRGSHSFRGL